MPKINTLPKLHGLVVQMPFLNNIYWQTIVVFWRLAFVYVHSYENHYNFYAQPQTFFMLEFSLADWHQRFASLYVPNVTCIGMFNCSSNEWNIFYHCEGVSFLSYFKILSGTLNYVSLHLFSMNNTAVVQPPPYKGQPQTFGQFVPNNLQDQQVHTFWNESKKLRGALQYSSSNGCEVLNWNWNSKLEVCTLIVII